MPNVIEFHPERNSDDWRNNVETLLKSCNGKFHFQKVNGELRDMYCTLNPNVLPESGNTEPMSQGKPGILTVYDIEAEGWRSMRDENVITFKYIGDQTSDREQTSTFVRS